MKSILRAPATISLLVFNIVIFTVLYFQAPDRDTGWIMYLLEHGALFTPYVLNGDWYRIVTHQLLHGHVLHLVVNMYALITLGMTVEFAIGSKKFLSIYLLGGIAAAVASMWFNLYTIGVGASGALFAVFGYTLVQFLLRKEERYRAIPMIVNFAIFLAIGIVFQKELHFDNAAHIGGFLFGGVLAAVSIASGQEQKLGTADVGAMIVLGATFLFLPRYQLHYFNFFQRVLAVEDSTSAALDYREDEVFLAKSKRAIELWDTTLVALDSIDYLPRALHHDTFNLRRYIRYQKARTKHRFTLVANESYIYMDSIEATSDSLRKYTQLDYPLNVTPTHEAPEPEPSAPRYETVHVWYDSNWMEIPEPPAPYFRIGQRDSIGRWQGSVVDHFADGTIQMKGSYKDDLRDGVFIYYRDRHRYEAAGLYRQDRRVGKWENFHPNGRIESEIYFRDRYFLKSYWDSTGVQMVRDGNGREVHRHPNGVIATEGQYIDGYQEGYWYGRHEDGSMYFEENYLHGRLLNGRARNKSRQAVYDETTLYALPEVGMKKLNEYFISKTRGSDAHGVVKLSFRVTVKSRIVDIRIEQSASKLLDDRAKEILLTGPKWLPARIHGLEPADGYGFVSIEF